MSNLVGQQPLEKYIRFYDMTDVKKTKEGVNIDFFDFAPAKAKMVLGRGSKKGDHLPLLEELIDEKDATYVSGQENFKKHFDSKLISRNHASVRWHPTQLYPSLLDEHSTHGTYLMHLESGMGFSDVPDLKADDPRWTRVASSKATPLKDGDVIQLGTNIKIDAPLRLFVEVYLHEHYLGNSDKVKMAEVISDDEDGDDDDEVVETTDPKLELQQTVEEKLNQAKKMITVVLSDDEDNDVEDFDPDLTVGVEAFSDGNANQEELNLFNIICPGSDEGIGPSDDESDADSVIESDEDGVIESDEDDDKDQVMISDEEGVQENDEEEEEEGEIMKTPSTKDAAVIQHLQKLFEIVEYEDGMEAYDNISDKMEDDFPGEMDQDFIDSIIYKGVQGDDNAPLVTESSSSQSEQDDVEEEEVGDAASTSGSSSSASSSETKITLSDVDSTEVFPVEMVKENTIVENVTMETLAEKPAIVEEEITQLAGNKRSHDEVEEAEFKNNESTVTTTIDTVMPSNEAKITQSKNLMVAPSLPPQKKIKLFGAGLAAGLVAGMVGTFVGLSSLALSDSSLV